MLARGKTIENRLAQLFSEPLGARFGDRSRRASRCERVVRTDQAGDANAAESSALRPDAAKAKNPLAYTGAGAAAPRNATSNGRIADAEREARSANSAAAVWRRCAFAAASAACGRYESAAAHSSPRAAREDAGLRRGMGQDETRVERWVADVARFRDAMPDALGALNR